MGSCWAAYRLSLSDVVLFIPIIFLSNALLMLYVMHTRAPNAPRNSDPLQHYEACAPTADESLGYGE
jgi:hypothetical protein